MIIPSVNCTKCEGSQRYNSSLSSSYQFLGLDIQIDSGWFFGRGNLSLDTVTVGSDVHIPAHPFLEASELSLGALLAADSDTVLGLAIEKPSFKIPEDRSSTHLPSVLSTIKRSKALERNIFSILLPRDETDLGDLTFGAINTEMYEGEMSTHPLYPPNASEWQLEASAISIVDPNGTVIASEPLPGYTASLLSGYPFINLPLSAGHALYKASGADCSDECHGCEVPCDSLDQLPHIVFTLGGGNVTITGRDYTYKSEIVWPFCGNKGPYCTLLAGTEAGRTDEEKRIWLGSSFFRGLYSVFDVDARSVHCKLTLPFNREQG